MASSSTSAAARTGIVPTQTEAFLFFYVIKNMKTKPDVDWDAVAADAGFKSGEVAKVRFGQVKRKLGVEGGVPKVVKPRIPALGKSKPPVRRSKASGPVGVTKTTKRGGKGAAASSLTPEMAESLLAGDDNDDYGKQEDDGLDFDMSTLKAEPFDPLMANQAAYGRGMDMSLDFEPVAQPGASFAYRQAEPSKFGPDFEDDLV